MRKSLALLSCLMLMGLGIASSFAVEDAAEAVICPTCKSETVAKPRPKGGVQKKMVHVCPSCGMTHKENGTGEMMHVCKKCGAEINECATCQSKM